MVVCEETHIFFFFFNQLTCSPRMILWAGLIQPSSPVPSPPYCLFPIESLLRGASLEFHHPWGFLVLLTVTGNQVSNLDPCTLTLIETQWIPLLELLQKKKKKQNLKIGRINTRSLDGKEWGQYSRSHNPKNKKQDHLTLFPSRLSESVKKNKQNTTLRWRLQTCLFLPSATVRRSGLQGKERRQGQGDGLAASSRLSGRGWWNYCLFL